MQWLTFSQSVLEKVSFDRALFRKELRKLLPWCSPAERLALLRWCRGHLRPVVPLAVLLLAGGLTAAVAQSFQYANGLLLTARDAATGQVHYGFDDRQPGYRLKPLLALPFRSEGWRLRTPDTSFRFRATDVWGVRWHGRTYRLWQTSALELMHSGPIQLYAVRSSRNDWYFFSRTPDGPVYALTSRDLLREYADDANVVAALRRLKWHQDPADILPATGQPRVLSWFGAETLVAQTDAPTP